jgi:adenine-specific DNA-methyltransferase
MASKKTMTVEALKHKDRRTNIPTVDPFDPPATGRIAVKVINHYGDEVLKVFDVR